MASLVAPKLPEVESFLLEGIVPGVVGGEDWCGSGDTTFQSRDPGSGELLAEVHAYTAADVNRSVEKANESFKKSGWSTLAPNDRAVRLHRFADLVEQQKKVVSQVAKTRPWQKTRLWYVRSGFNKTQHLPSE